MTIRNFPMRQIFRALRIKPLVVSSAIALSCATAMMPTQTYAEGKISANFKNTEITEFINTVGKNLQKTMIVDPNVRGKVSVRSYDLLTKEQYYQFFLNVLEVYGYAAVKMDDNVIKILREKTAKTSSIPVVGSNNDLLQGDEMVTRIVEVKNVTVRELVPLLRQLSDQAGGGNVTNYDPANVIMLTGTAAVVNRLVKIIERVDHAGDQGVQIIRLKYASAAEMVRIVESMNKSVGKSITPTFLIPKIVADERTNSVIVSGELKARERVTNLVKRLDSELKTNGNTRVYYLKYAKAEDLVDVLKGVSESIEAESATAKTNNRRSSQKRNISINAHEDTNTLVITAEPDMLRSLEAVIRQLDVRRAQVLVEAIIVEVLETDGASLGVQWYSKDGGFTQFTNGPATISSVAAGAVAARSKGGETVTTVDSNGNPVTRTNPTTDGDYSILAQALGQVSGMTFGIANTNWGAIIQAVSSDTNSNILATPSITTLDNEEASFLVGQNIPILTGSTAGGNNSNPFQTVDRQDVGIKLKVTPQVNEGTGVQLTIEQEVSSVSGATGIDTSLNKREIKTTVMADSGATIVLGGLIDDDVQESQQKVPLLGDIPIIGHLFKSTRNTVRKRNLMVFLRPTIVRDKETMNSISQSKYNFIRAKEILRREEGLSLVDDTHLPILPKWNDELTLPPSFKEYIKDKEEQEIQGKDTEQE